MALLTLIPSTGAKAEASQIIGTVNGLIAQINGNAGLGGLAQGAFTANGSVATAMSSVGPTGSHTTVQKWLTVVDDTGATGYIPIF